MRKLVFTCFTAFTCCFATAGADESALPKRSEQLAGKGASAGTYAAIGNSMFAWGIVLFVVIVVLACTINNSSTAH